MLWARIAGGGGSFTIQKWLPTDKRSVVRGIMLHQYTAVLIRDDLVIGNKDN